MPKSVITKWREVNRSINQMIKSSSSESEHDIMNNEHMHENNVNDVNDSSTHIENSSYNYISSTETASNSNEGHFEITNESSLRQELAIWATNNNCTRTCVTQLLFCLSMVMAMNFPKMLGRCCKPPEKLKQQKNVMENIITLVWKKELYNAYYKIHFLEIKLS